MKRGSILGYDLSEKNCQISYYDETKEEPVTLETAVENYQIPLILGYYNEHWVYGKEAKRLAEVQEENTISDLYVRAVRREKVEFAGKTRDAVWLLAKYIELTLEGFPEIEYITFSVADTNIDMSKMLKGIGRHIGVPKERVSVQDYKESFCQYMFYQPKELWQYESALFYCDAQQIRAFMLRKLNVAGNRGPGMFVTVDEVANAHMKELAAIYQVLRMWTRQEMQMSSSKPLSKMYLRKKWYPPSI